MSAVVAVVVVWLGLSALLGVLLAFRDWRMRRLTERRMERLILEIDRWRR